jgi:hypothetical protein
MAGDSVQRSLDIWSNLLRFSGQLEQRRVRQGAKADRGASGREPDMPVPPVKSFNLHISDQHAIFLDCLAFEVQAKHFPHRAAAAVAADQEVRTQRFASGERSLDTLLILPECRQTFPNSTCVLNALKRSRMIASVRDCATSRGLDKARFPLILDWYPASLPAVTGDRHECGISDIARRRPGSH